MLKLATNPTMVYYGRDLWVEVPGNTGNTKGKVQPKPVHPEGSLKESRQPLIDHKVPKVPKVPAKKELAKPLAHPEFASSSIDEINHDIRPRMASLSQSEDSDECDDVYEDECECEIFSEPPPKVLGPIGKFVGKLIENSTPAIPESDAEYEDRLTHAIGQAEEAILHEFTVKITEFLKQTTLGPKNTLIVLREHKEAFGDNFSQIFSYGSSDHITFAIYADSPVLEAPIAPLMSQIRQTGLELMKKRVIILQEELLKRVRETVLRGLSRLAEAGNATGFFIRDVAIDTFPPSMLKLLEAKGMSIKDQGLGENGKDRVWISWSKLR
jgi:hypothetical protein